ncbi:MAG: succinylglutamate desuccinylase/aspartoacylase family protein [Proteobacteria bacterium]|nr:succinylglutamate desuccinylase/aspartoacylase family protein [Pseudomonadota bacterium]
MVRTSEWLQIDMGDDHAHLPVIVVDSQERGPTVVVTANVHGDESSGVVAVHALDKWLQDNLLAGRVVLYPSLNPRGLALNTRRVPHDGADLNRAFPGGSGGAASQRLAAAIWQSLDGWGLDVLVDLHTDSAGSIPYSIVDRAVALKGDARRILDAKLVELAENSGLTVLLEYPDDLYVRFGLDRSLAGAVVNRFARPALTIEAGPRGVVDWDAVGVMQQALRGVLGGLGLIEHGVVVSDTRVDSPKGHWRRSTTARTRRAGVFVPSLRAGDTFRPGVVLGVVRDLAGQPLDEVRAQSPGVVVSWVDSCWIEAGQVVGTVGIMEDA